MLTRPLARPLVTPLASLLAGSGASFNPLDLAPFAWYDSSVATSLYNATSGGSVTTTNGNVRRWEDLSGNARHLTQAGATSAPTLTNTSGLRGVLFDGVDDAIGRAATATTLPCTVYCCWTPISHTINDSIWDFGTSGARQIFRQIGSAQMSVNGAAACGRSPLAIPTHAAHKTATGTISARLNRGAFVSATQTSGNGTVIQIASTGGTSNFGHVRMHEMLIVSGLQTDETDAKVAAYFETKWGMTRPRLMVDGNSLSSGGVSLPVADVWPTILAPEIPSWDVVNWAVSGQNITTMTADAALEFGRQPVPTRAKNILFAWECVNQMVGGTSAEATATAMKNYCIARRAEGYKVICATMLPTNSVSEANWNTLNTILRSTPSAYCDALVDVAANATIGGWGAQNNTTYYNADKLHLTAAGQIIVKDMIKSAVLTI